MQLAFGLGNGNGVCRSYKISLDGRNANQLTVDALNRNGKTRSTVNRPVKEFNTMKSYQGLRVSALMAALLALPLAQNAFAAAVVGLDPKTTVTASMDGGVTKAG